MIQRIRDIHVTSLDASKKLLKGEDTSQTLVKAQEVEYRAKVEREKLSLRQSQLHYQKFFLNIGLAISSSEAYVSDKEIKSLKLELDKKLSSSLDKQRNPKEWEIVEKERNRLRFNYPFGPFESLEDEISIEVNKLAQEEALCHHRICNGKGIACVATGVIVSGLVIKEGFF